MDIRMDDAGEGIIPVRGKIVPPIIFFLFLRDFTLVSRPHFMKQPASRHQGKNQHKAQRQEGSGEGGKAQPFHYSGWIGRPPSIETYGNGEKEYREAQYENPVESNRRPVEFHHRDIAPGNNSPEIPVAHPVHFPRSLSESGENKCAQADAVGGKTITGKDVNRRSKCTPYDEGREQQQNPQNKKRHQGNGNGALDK